MVPVANMMLWGVGKLAEHAPGWAVALQTVYEMFESVLNPDNLPGE